MLSIIKAWGAVGDQFSFLTEEEIEMIFQIISEEEKTCQVGCEYSNYYVFGVRNNTEGHVTIPSVANGYRVTRISQYAFSGINPDCNSPRFLSLKNNKSPLDPQKSHGCWVFFACILPPVC